MRTVLRRLAKALGVIALVLVVLALIPIVQVEMEVHAARAALPAIPAPQPVAVDATATPVLILLHGAGLNAHMWDPVRRSLDPKYRVIALDLPGHGVHRDGTFTFQAAAAEVAAAARSAAPAPVVLVGDSLGGFSAMAAAAAIPREQLKGLVIGGASGDYRWTQFPGYIGGLLLVHGLLLFTDEDRLAGRALANFPLSATDAHALLAAGMNLRAVAPAVRALMNEDFHARLAAIDAPVLIVNGALDKNNVEREPGFLAVARHGSSLRFPDTQHGVSMRKPAEFAAAINEFTTRVSRPIP